MKIKTSALTGRALDWAVCLAIGGTANEDNTEVQAPNNVYYLLSNGKGNFTPSTDWAQCGQLIDTYLIELNNQVISENEVEHWATCMDEYIYGSTALEAACRIVVHVKLGDEVEIPDELVEGV
ncbi:DUF2591 domain-containing protein [Xenorhabdus bovienii]|uniref:DUF2591 domain-containing protein n=1 Tax=Xenorhabdus bovienii TaxID=40576 RepID=A0AAJ1JCN1_XENBV|nr:phage protein NinX family protein [Xenorhabdus bovienii]MDE1480181.1 DUF2591 domain-containing protein [Xenorhabdus bovienii]MDE1488834.1 DUF2591 domain-containing protein [Xenorhabdus bovienii]MDE9480022.1 DUF2591 domain-containing protein [Xenorhabdus bovienii]MDE9512439.1 DUF2591 domain-containing protein [Xenorhabdus bovienii]MDE9524069.1 DUF2591 domain-containing protein [Xenorhabdus bovienii]